MQRSFDPAVLEMMDRPQPVSPELERDLQRLRQLNRWFGSYRLVLKIMQRWIKPGTRLRILILQPARGTLRGCLSISREKLARTSRSMLSIGNLRHYKSPRN